MCQHARRTLLVLATGCQLMASGACRGGKLWNLLALDNLSL